MSTTNLDVLPNAAGLERMLKEFQEQIQQQVQELHHEVIALKEDHVGPTPPEKSLDLKDTSRSTSPPLDPTPHDTDSSLRRIQSASWAEEMEILQPQGDEDLYGSVKLKRPTRVGNTSDGGSLTRIV